MTRKPVFAAFAAVVTAGLLATGTVTSASAAGTSGAGQGAPAAPGGFQPGSDYSLVVYVCPFPMQVHDQLKWFKEVLEPNGAWDYNIDQTVTFTNLDTGKQWQVKGSQVVHWVDNPDGSLTQTSFGVGVAYGPLHTVYYGVWSRTFPDGVPRPTPFTGVGKTVDICQQLN